MWPGRDAEALWTELVLEQSLSIWGVCRGRRAWLNLGLAELSEVKLGYAKPKPG